MQVRETLLIIMTIKCMIKCFRDCNISFINRFLVQITSNMSRIYISLLLHVGFFIEKVMGDNVMEIWYISWEEVSCLKDGTFVGFWHDVFSPMYVSDSSTLAKFPSLPCLPDCSIIQETFSCNCAQIYPHVPYEEIKPLI